jgi:low temperature requirement protein LtrA
MLTAVFWIAGGLADGVARLAFWTLAIVLDLISPSLGFRVPGLGRSTTADWNVEGGHMAERCALFIIIALGESILVTGATFSGMPWTGASVSAFVASFVGSLAMWWLYFDVAAELGTRTISASSDPGRLARLAYTYVHLPLVAGIIVAAVADEFVLTHPLGLADGKTIVTVLGSVGLYLGGHVLFAWSIAGRLPTSSISGLAVIAGLATFAARLSPVLLMSLASAVLVYVSVWETLVGEEGHG